MDLVSIIVPVYNAELFIDSCVDSILKQTYKNWELILVDDGSKDSSYSICSKYALKDSRIRAYHKENSGVSDTRNVAIEYSQGKYITFVDVDDWINETYIDYLMQYKMFDWVIEGYEYWPSRFKAVYSEESIYLSKHNSHLDICLFDHPSSWSMLFSADIIKKNNIRFNVSLRSREDHLFNLQYLEHCNSIKILNRQDYNVTERVTPVALKFKMHREDLIEAIDSLSTVYKRITCKWGISDYIDERFYVIMNQYFLDDFLTYNGDDDYFMLYQRYFNCSDKYDMYKNPQLSSLSLMLDGIIACYQVENFDKASQLIKIFKSICSDEVVANADFKDKTYLGLAIDIKNNNQKSLEKRISAFLFKARMIGYMQRIFRPFVYSIKYF